jgi:hypothetical protein
MGADGEPTYRVTEKCQDIFPEFYQFHHEMLNTTATELWNMGVIEIQFTKKGEVVCFNKQNYKRLLEVINDLTEDQIQFLEAMGAPIERLK